MNEHECVYLQSDPGRVRCQRCGHTRALPAGRSASDLHRQCPRATPIGDRPTPSAVSAAPQTPKSDTACLHRGGVLREVSCKGCKNADIKLPIHACALFGECTLADYRHKSPDFAAAKVCSACPSRKAAEPELPSIVKRAYTLAVDKFADVRAGRPRRSAEEIRRIFETHCRVCKLYNAAEKACSVCGCPVSPDQPEDNRIAWASLGCSAPEPKWGPEAIEPPDVASLINALTIEPRVPLAQLRIVTACDRKFFNAAQLLVASIRRSHAAPITLVDLGLDDEQRAWLQRHGVQTTPIADEQLVMPRSIDKWQIWNKPAYLRLFDRGPARHDLLWLDADTFVADSLLPAAAAIDAGPLLTSDTCPWPRRGGSPRDYLFNNDRLYRLYPTPRRMRERINAGVLGLRLPRDREFLDAWLNTVRRAAGDARFRDLLHCQDQGALIYTIEQKLARDPDPAASQFNAADVLPDDQPLDALPSAIVELRRRHKTPAVVHFSGEKKPYTRWPRRLSIELSDFEHTRPDLALYVLGHNREALDDPKRCPPLPHVTRVFLPDLEPDNSLAESRVFQRWPLDAQELPFVGFCSESWNEKYAGKCRPIEKLHRLRLDERTVSAAAPIDANWLDYSEEHHPGMAAIVVSLAEAAGITRRQLRRPSFWSNNFLSSKTFVLDLARFHRWALAWTLDRYGPRPPYEAPDEKPHRHLSYLAERFTMAYFCSRTDLSLEAIPK